MWTTQKLTPSVGMDPMQQKMMQLMPLIFGVMFAFFPAGLVLYWVTNGALGLAQQWWNTKRYSERQRRPDRNASAPPKPAAWRVSLLLDGAFCDHGDMPQASTDTIVAIATAAGAGGVGVVRLSGPHSRTIAETICARGLVPRHAHHARFRDGDGATLDDGIALISPRPPATPAKTWSNCRPMAARRVAATGGAVLHAGRSDGATG
jgi:hypothetical protein